jgi:hypothetical protein
MSIVCLIRLVIPNILAFASRNVTPRAKLKPLAPGLTPRAVLDKLAAIQMLDVHFPRSYADPEPLRRTERRPEASREAPEA